MVFKDITKEEFDETYRHVEELRKAGKLEEEVNIADATCFLIPPTDSPWRDSKSVQRDIKQTKKNLIVRATNNFLNYISGYLGRHHYK